MANRPAMDQSMYENLLDIREPDLRQIVEPLTCYHCCYLLFKPVQVKRCGHRFCKRCLLQMTSAERIIRCSECRKLQHMYYCDMTESINELPELQTYVAHFKQFVKCLFRNKNNEKLDMLSIVYEFVNDNVNWTKFNLQLSSDSLPCVWRSDRIELSNHRENIETLPDEIQPKNEPETVCDEIEQVTDKIEKQEVLESFDAPNSEPIGKVEQETLTKDPEVDLYPKSDPTESMSAKTEDYVSITIQDGGGNDDDDYDSPIVITRKRKLTKKKQPITDKKHKSDEQSSAPPDEQEGILTRSKRKAKLTFKPRDELQRSSTLKVYETPPAPAIKSASDSSVKKKTPKLELETTDTLPIGNMGDSGHPASLTIKDQGSLREETMLTTTIDEVFVCKKSPEPENDTNSEKTEIEAEKEPPEADEKDGHQEIGIQQTQSQICLNKTAITYGHRTIDRFDQICGPKTKWPLREQQLLQEEQQLEQKKQQLEQEQTPISMRPTQQQKQCETRSWLCPSPEVVEWFDDDDGDDLTKSLFL